MVIPLFILDVGISIYHHVCFRLYSIPLVQRSKYIRLDRGRLQYLPWYDKINCAYCGYGNGLLGYATEVAAQTERYWCGIKEMPGKGFVEPKHRKDFIPYGNKGAYEEYCKLEKKAAERRARKSSPS